MLILTGTIGVPPSTAIRPAPRLERLEWTADRQLAFRVDQDVEDPIEARPEQLEALAHPTLARQRERVRHDGREDALEGVLMDSFRTSRHRQLRADAKRQPRQDDGVVEVETMVRREQDRAVNAVQPVKPGHPDSAKGVDERVDQEDLGGQADRPDHRAERPAQEPGLRFISRATSPRAMRSWSVASGSRASSSTNTPSSSSLPRGFLAVRAGATAREDRANSGQMLFPSTKRGVEPTLGFEPRTCCLRNSCSAAELCRRRTIIDAAQEHHLFAAVRSCRGSCSDR